MAIAPVNKTAGDSGGSVTSADTASLTTTAGKLYLLTVNAYRSSGTAQPPQPTVTFNGLGLAFDVVTSVDIDPSGTDRQTQWLLRGVASSSSSGTLTIDFGAVACKIDWIVDEVDGVDTGGTNGSAAIVQSASAAYASGAASGSVALAAFGDATNNVAYGSFGVQSSSSGTVNYTAGTGFTKLAEDAGNVATAATEYHVGEDTSVDMSWAGTLFRSGGIAVELKAASGGAVIDAAPQALSAESAATGSGVSVLRGLSALVGESSAAGVGAAVLRGLSALVAESSIAGAGVSLLSGGASLVGESGLTGSGTVLLPSGSVIDAAAVALSAQSNATGSPTVLVGASPIELAALSALSGSGALRLNGAGDLVAASDGTGSGVLVLYGHAALSALGSLLGSGGIAPKFGAPTVLALDVETLNALGLQLAPLNHLDVEVSTLNRLALEVTSP